MNREPDEDEADDDDDSDNNDVDDDGDYDNDNEEEHELVVATVQLMIQRSFREYIHRYYFIIVLFTCIYQIHLCCFR